MTSEYEFQFPFTTRKEIIDWADFYTNDQSQKIQSQEQAVIDIEKEVRSPERNKTPGGYLCQSELLKMARWKHYTLPSKIDKNPPGHIEKTTAEAFCFDDDWKKLETLKKINGVRESVGSVILHFYDKADYPILDKFALCSVGIDYRKVYYDEKFWRKYVKFSCAEAERYQVSMRTLDRALWKYSKCHAAFTIKVMVDKTLFLELERRGYDFASLREKTR